MLDRLNKAKGFDLHNVEEEDHWISVSDLMAGLMMVFLFVSIALMHSAFMERDKIREIALTYEKTQLAIYQALLE
ncbi:OmpA family protein, partial [Candidatus Parcubacteria bacterium]